MTPPRPHSPAIASRSIRRKHFIVTLPGVPVDILAYRPLGRPVRRGQELWRFRIIWHTPNRQGPGFAYAGVTDEWWVKPVTRAKIAKYAEQALVRSFRHEVRELLAVDGRRAFPDPHARKRRRA